MSTKSCRKKGVHSSDSIMLWELRTECVLCNVSTTCREGGSSSDEYAPIAYFEPDKETWVP